MFRTMVQTALALVVVAAFSAPLYAGGKDHVHHAEVGKPAPLFALTDHEGGTVDIADFIKDEKIVVLEWFNPDCPFVVKHHKKLSTMRDLAARYHDKDVVWLAVNSSHYADRKYNAKWAKQWNIDYPILNDQSGEVGRMYRAATTPHMYVIDTRGKLVYAGAIDNNRSPRPASNPDEVVNYVAQALGALLNGEDIAVSETKPYGCSVKYSKRAAAASRDANTVARAPCGDCP